MRIGIIILLAIIALAIQPLRFSRIDAGHTGIRFNHFGVTDKKGVSDHSLVSGAVFYNWWTQGVYEYPHYWQDAIFEDVSFNSLEGEPIITSLKVVYRFHRDNIPAIFDEYRLSPYELQKTIIESLVLEGLSTEGGKLSAVDIMGVKRDQLLTEVAKALNDKYGDRFEFQLVTFSDKLQPSENVAQAIQSVIQAQEKAKSAQAHTVEVEESAKQKIIQARADSSSMVIRAAGQAREVELVQKQLAQSHQYIDYQRVMRWDGKMPMVTGSNTPFIDLKVK